MFSINDSLVNSSFSESVKSLIYGFEEPVNWQYSDRTNRVEENDATAIKPKGAKETFYFSGYLEKESKLYQLFLALIEDELRPLSLSVKEILMFRSNIYTRKDFSYSDVHHTVHVDGTDLDLMSFLYYVDSSDGATTFFNEKYSPEMNETLLSENCKVDPLQGRYVLFESNRYHASASPTRHDTRTVVNVIFRVQ